MKEKKCVVYRKVFSFAQKNLTLILWHKHLIKYQTFSIYTLKIFIFTKKKKKKIILIMTSTESYPNVYLKYFHISVGSKPQVRPFDPKN